MSANTSTHLEKRLTKHGNSLALVIDRPVLDLLGIDEDTVLSIRTDGRCLILTPAPPDHTQRVRGSMRKMHDKYAGALEKLAK